MVDVWQAVCMNMFVHKTLGLRGNLCILGGCCQAWQLSMSYPLAASVCS